MSIQIYEVPETFAYYDSKYLENAMIHHTFSMKYYIDVRGSLIETLFFFLQLSPVYKDASKSLEIIDKRTHTT